jgi:hypothetical protein
MKNNPFFWLIQKMIDEGHLEHYQNDIKFIREHGKEWV